MKKITSHCGQFNPRVLLGFGLCSLGTLLAGLTLAANGLFTANAANAATPMASMPLALTAAPGWSIVSSPNSSTAQDNHLFGVTCTSASQCWAVGNYFNDSGQQTLIERWNGSAWAIVASPNSGTGSFLLDATCTSASECWAVGSYFNASGSQQSLIERWNGTSWSIVPSPNAGNYTALADVSCASASQCWAVGSYTSALFSSHQTLIERWNGSSWTIIPSPNATGIESFLNGVTCVSASDCWAVGFGDSGTANQTLIERWNGSSWAIVTSPNTSATQQNQLDSVTCLSASDCWAVGNFTTANFVYQTLVEHWNGSSWAIVTSPNTSATQHNVLSSVTCVSASQCWAVGIYQNDTSVPRTLIERWNGSSWAIVTSPNGSAQETRLNGATCVSASECWAVGSYVAGNPAHSQTLIEELAPSPLRNVSTRLKVLSGNSVAINGFVIGGIANKQVLVRGLGPTLAQVGLSGALADPTLQLSNGSGAVVASNDDWKNTQQAAITATGLAPPNDSESAILATLAPGNYTAILRGKNNTTGLGLVEAYDLDQSVSSILANISTRGFVGTDQEVMIEGFVVGTGGSGSVKVIVRALGPTLTQFNVPNVLADPTLELHDANGAVIASNDNWQSTQKSEIEASGFAPPNAAESAIIIARPPGNTTAVVRGKNNSTGNALVEVYQIP